MLATGRRVRSPNVPGLTYPWGTALGTGGNLVIAEEGATDEVIMLAASGNF